VWPSALVSRFEHMFFRLVARRPWDSGFFDRHQGRSSFQQVGPRRKPRSLITLDLSRVIHALNLPLARADYDFAYLHAVVWYLRWCMCAGILRWHCNRRW